MLNVIRHFTPFSKSFILPFFYSPHPHSSPVHCPLFNLVRNVPTSIYFPFGGGGGWSAAVLSAHLKLPSFFNKLHTALWIR